MRLLVLAPHPDDELLGCAGLMARVRRQGGDVRVLLVSRGEAGGDPGLRYNEFVEGLKSVGVEEHEVWNEPDGRISIDDTIQRRYQDLLAAWMPTDVALPASSETHADHRRVTRGFLEAATGVWRGGLWFYETVGPMPQVNHTEAIDLPAKVAAVSRHTSQLNQFDYTALTRSLAGLRGAQVGIAAAEAFLHFEWDGSEQNFFEGRPLVSVVVRADQAPFLAIALQSLMAQTYDHLEACVVWHGPDHCPPLPAPLRTRVVQGKQGVGSRGANLNAGLRAARGALLAFLDQDDVWLPDHLTHLVAEVLADEATDIAYGDYRLVYCRWEGAEVVVTGAAPTSGQDHRAGLLYTGNHIPLNTFVCRKRLARQLGFDESLDAYEDWDFLARAEMSGAGFRRVPELISEYRVFPLSGEVQDLAAIHERKGYVRWRRVVLEKIAASLKAGHVETVLRLLGQLQTERQEVLVERDVARVEREAARERQVAVQARWDLAVRWAEVLAPSGPGVSAFERLTGSLTAKGPCFSILLPVCDPQPEFLCEVVHSVLRQNHANWQLCIADDESRNPEVIAILDRLATLRERDPRIRVSRREKRGGIVAASMTALETATGDWVAFLDHDDRLRPHALFELALCIKARPALECAYTDSCTIDRNGVVLHEFHKPEWAPETLLHLNYVNHLSVVRRDVFDAVGRLRPGFDGSQDWDLWLRLAARPGLEVAHVRHVLYDWRATETSVAYAVSAKPYVIDAARRCTREYLVGQGLQEVESIAPTDRAGLRYRWRAMAQPLTVIVPTHRNAGDLSRLVDSLLACTYAAPLQVVLIANRVDPDNAAMAQVLSRAAQSPGWQIQRDDRVFNWAALNNRAVRTTDTPWLLFLNDDVELCGTDGLMRLVAYLNLSEAIGAVGARLLYGRERNSRVQHDGVAVSQEWVARNIVDESDGTGIGIPRNVSAVTGACLLTRRSVFEAVGGFDERFRVSYNDVDYCLALARHGYRTVQASDVEWVHHESRTRGRIDDVQYRELLAEGDLMRRKWGNFLEDRLRLIYTGRYIASRILHVTNDPPS